MKRNLLKIARLGISAGLIIYLVIKLDFHEIVGHLSTVRFLPLTAAVALEFGMVFANTIRWKVLLRARGIDMSLARLVYYYLMGLFFSSFLPTSIGGDVARVIAVSSETDRGADAFASVVVERLLGFFVLLPVGLASIPFVAGTLEDWKLILTVGIIATCGFAAVYIVLLRSVARRLSRLLTPLFSLLWRFRLRERLEKGYEAILSYRDSKGAVYGGLGISVASKVSWIFACYFVGKALELDIGFASLMLIVPVVELVRMLPISVSGIGVREAAFVAMLRQFGVEDSLGFAFAVVVYVIFFGFALVGGLLYGTRQFVSRS
jgi:uncharacterized protein (TIRG00374 family)